MSLSAHDIHAADGTRLNLWATGTDAAEAVVFVHGAITNGRALFAPPLDGSYSWLAATTARGRAAYALDVRGYGDSEQPGVFEDPPGENPPAVRAPTAGQDITAAVEYAMARHNAVHLVGVSWGTMTSGYSLGEAGLAVDSYAAVAPVYKPAYDFTLIREALDVEGELGAYMTETRTEAEERMGASELFEAIWAAQAGSNQGIEGQNAYKGPMGSFADTIDCCQGTPPYDATNIEVPTLVLRGSADQIAGRSDALTLYDELGAAVTEYAEIGGGDHYMMHGPERERVYTLVDHFQNRA